MLFSMFHPLGVASILSFIGVSFTMVVNRDAALDRKRIMDKCSGTPQEVYLNAGQDVVLTNPGFETGEFIEGCTTLYEVMMDRDDQDLGQWRIKVVMEEMNLPCSSSSLWLLEDGERTHNVQYCNEKKAETVFYSHEHMIDIKFKNKAKCLEEGGCAGTKVEMRISAEYVCGGRFDQDNGVITSPLYPANYINSEACIYDIVAPKKKRIALTCEYFDLSTKCDGHCGDHNGDRTYFQDITTFERYEGKELQGKTIKSKKNHHTFYFLSNSNDIEDKKRQYGFSCSYKFF
eukprot:TRINITY_DN228_c0_g1_i3.p1 TRINITY_DN228_c0_g1~~TRINITY_DN228_c0_g1_i3.p1  ORF type:complete len:289 (-),score=94.20 TRINITY_DN228_c0_g1_i3:93-959(-)